MRHPRILAVLIVLALAAVAALWWTRSTDDGQEPATTADRPAEETHAPPMLAGRAEETPPKPSPETVKTPPPSRPWETRAGFDLAKEGETRVVGRVLLEDGSPAPGAFVWKTYVYRAFSRSQAEAGRHDFMGAATKTQDDGTFRFNARQVRSKLGGAAILVRHGDLAALLLGPEDDGTLAELPDLVLGPAIRTEIDLVNAYGEPVAGAQGELRVHFGGYGIPALLLGDRSNAKGRLEFLPLPDKEDLLLEIRLRHKEYPDFEQKIDVDALRRGGVLRVELATGRTVRGRLVDAEGKAAGGRIILRAVGPDPEYARPMQLDGVHARFSADGEFEVRGVPIEKAQLLVYAVPPKMTRFVDFYQLKPHVIPLADGRHGEVVDVGVIPLEATGSIRGVVRGPEGDHLAGVRVDVNLRIEGVRGGGHAETDTNGQFVIPELPPAAYRVRAAHHFPGFGQRETHVDDVRPDGPPIELALRGESTLVLRFHPVGRPDLTAGIHGYHFSDNTDPNIHLGGGGRSSGPGKPLVRLKFEAGTHTITFTPRGHATVVVGPFEIFDDRETVLDIEISPE